MSGYNNHPLTSPIFHRSRLGGRGTRSGTSSPLSYTRNQSSYYNDMGSVGHGMSMSSNAFGGNYGSNYPMRGPRQRHQSSGDLIGITDNAMESSLANSYVGSSSGTLPRSRLMRQHRSFEGDLYHGDLGHERYFNPIDPAESRSRYDQTYGMSQQGQGNPGLTSSYLGSLSASNIAGRYGSDYLSNRGAPSMPHMPQGYGPGTTTGDPMLDHELDNLARFGQTSQQHYANAMQQQQHMHNYMNPTGSGGGMNMNLNHSLPPQYNPVRVRDPYSLPMGTLQKEYDGLRREYEMAVQKLNSTMTSIKTFWSPELKKERALRKEETAKLALLTEQYRMGSQDSQVCLFLLSLFNCNCIVVVRLAI